MGVQRGTADRDGSIVYRMSGRVPRRRQGVSGLLPLTGWRPEDDWQGFHDPDELPQRTDPSEGYLATANDDLNQYGIAHPINMPSAPYRASRIAEELASRGDWSVEDVGRLQMDTLSPQAQRFMSVLRPLLADDKRFAHILQWDGSYEDRSTPPGSRGSTVPGSRRCSLGHAVRTPRHTYSRRLTLSPASSGSSTTCY